MSDRFLAVLEDAGPTPAALPEGLRYVPNFLTPTHEASIIAGLAPLDWDGRGLFKKYGQIVRRREIDFLKDYVRSGSRNISEGQPLPSAATQNRPIVATSKPAIGN